MSDINSQHVLYNKVGNDENFTPAYGVEPILEYIPKFATVWCPFDTKDSEFVKLISKTNKVVYSHIEDGQDFFDYEPEKWDILISNPPFKNKRAFFERAIDLGRPFALLMANTWLNDAAPKQLFEHKQLQLLMFDRRIKFVNPEGRPNNKITFSSSYFCYNLLPKDIIMKKIKENL